MCDCFVNFQEHTKSPEIVTTAFIFVILYFRLILTSNATIGAVEVFVKMRILIAEDEVTIARALKVMLEKNKFSVDMVHNGDDALDYIRAGQYDALVLDIMMPGKDGIEVLTTARAEGVTTPALFLTAKSEVADRVAGLDAGADDYLPKPFGIMELISRVKARLRGAATARLPADYSYGGLYLSEEKHLVTVDGTPVELTYKEFELLKLLLSAPGNAFTRDVIMERIWGYNYELSSRTLDMHVKTLRQKLGAKGAMIQTIRNVGFKLERLEE